MDSRERIVLVEIDCHPHIRRNNVIVHSHAIHLYRKQDRNAHRLQIVRRCNRSRSAPALSQQDHTRVHLFLRIKLSVVIGIQCLPDQLERKSAMMIRDRFGEDSRPFPQPEYQLPNAAVFIVPPVVPSQKTDNQG